MKLRKGKKYLVGQYPGDKVPLTMKYYGFKTKNISAGIKQDGHLFLCAGDEDSGYVLTDKRVDQLVREWSREGVADAERNAEIELSATGTQ